MRPTQAMCLSLIVLASSGPEAVEIDPRTVVAIGNKLVKFKDQLKLSGVEDGCDDFHYHPKTGSSVTTLTGDVIVDERLTGFPSPEGCGYGKFHELARGLLEDAMVTALDSDGDGLPDALEFQLGLNPNDPDSDDNRILDGDEDADSDGSINLDEFRDKTSSLNRDSDGDGILDGLERVNFADPAVIPVVINLLKNSNADPVTIREALALVTNIVVSARKLVLIRIRQHDANGGDDGSGGGIAGDGILTPAERTKVRDMGDQEVFDVFGKRRLGSGGVMPLGLSISFAAAGGLRTEDDLSMIGEAEKGGYSILIEAGGTKESIAANILHGIYLLIGLENSTQTPETDDDDPGNFMTPGAAGRDAFVDSPDPNKGFDNLKLTVDQKLKYVREGLMALDRFSWGYRFRSPGVRALTQGGSVYDGDQAEIQGFPIYNIAWVALSSDAESDTVEGVITTFGFLPDDIAFSTVTLSFVFDTDANASTGATVEIFPGIERQVILRVNSSGVPGGITLDAAVGEVHADQYAPIQVASTRNLNIEADLDIPGEPRRAQYTVQIPKDTLHMTAPQVPVGVIARTTPLSPDLSYLIDTALLTFDREAYLADPTLTLFDQFVRPGDGIDFDLAGFSSQSTFELDVDEVMVLEGTTDGSGSFSGSFVYPDNPSGPRAVSAVDADGNFAFNMLFVTDLAPVSVLLDKAGSGDIDVQWATNCESGAEGYGIYEGTLGSWYSHRSLTCTDAAGQSASITPTGGDRYYLVVANDGDAEGSYGRNSSDVERSAGGEPCRVVQAFGACPQ